MRSIKLHIIFLASILLTSTLYAGLLDGLTICLDPGHGGSDPGTVGLNGLYEKIPNLDIALKLEACLEGKGASIQLTRSTDKFLNPYQREAFIKELEPDLLVSIHLNATQESIPRDEITNYTKVIYYRSDCANLASNMAECQHEELGIESKGGTNPDSYNWVLDKTRGTCKGVLTELAFVSCRKEAELLCKGDGVRQDQMANAICKAIVDMYSFTVTVHPSELTVNKGAKASHTITVTNTNPKNIQTFNMKINPQGSGWSWSTTQFPGVTVAANKTWQERFIVQNDNASILLILNCVQDDNNVYWIHGTQPECNQSIC